MDFDKYYALAVSYLSYRSRSEKEIKDYLKKKNTPPDITGKVIGLLKEHKFINDDEFASLWVESRNRISPRSLRVLKMELKEKGIAQDIIEKVLSSYNSLSDLESAKIIVRKRLPRLINLEKEEIYKKLGGYLARKGYTWDVVKHSIDDCMREEYNSTQ